MELFGLEAWRHGRGMISIEFCSEKAAYSGTKKCPPGRAGFTGCGIAEKNLFKILY
jgi:hypothetical protein